MKTLNLSSEFMKLVELNKGSYKKAVSKILNFEEEKFNLSEKEKKIISNILNRLISILDLEIEFIDKELKEANIENSFFSKKKIKKKGKSL